MSIFFKVSLGCSLVLLFVFTFNLSLALKTQPPPIQVNFGSFTGIVPASSRIGSCSQDSSKQCLQIDWISQYVGAIYQDGIGLAAVLAVVMIMIGGFIYMTAGGNSTQVSKARDFIISSMTGLLLALFSFILLQTINPALISNKGIEVRIPEEVEISGQSSRDPIGLGEVTGRTPVDQRPEISSSSYFLPRETTGTGLDSFNELQPA